MVVPLPKCTKVPRVIGVLDASEGAANLQWVAICRFWYPKWIYGFIVCKMHDKPMLLSTVYKLTCIYIYTYIYIIIIYLLLLLLLLLFIA